LVNFRKEYIGYVNNVMLTNELKKSIKNLKKFLPKKANQAFVEWKKVIKSLPK